MPLIDTPLAELFSRHGEADWQRIAEAALKGKSVESLTSTSVEGLRIAPLHARAAGTPPRATRAKSGPWSVAQRIDLPDRDAANRQALIDLEGGADALVLAVEGAAGSRGFGIAATDERDLAATLAGVEIDLISLRLDAGDRTAALARAFVALAKGRRLTAAALDVDFGLDPIGCSARTGTPVSAPQAALAATLRDAGFAGHLMLADGRLYHEAGAGEAQELACVVATAVAYWRDLERAGVPLEAGRDEIAFLLAADADAFLGMAKFRALRHLWARVEAVCGVAPKPIRLHAETSWRMMSRRDPFVNVLRTGTAIFAAGLGGADTIAALPFTAALGLPDESARRIARNSQLLLLHESHLAVVEDPAAGSGALETTTRDLCERAWAMFQTIEQAGGMVEALRRGIPQAAIAATASTRRAAIARRRQPLTGTSEFPDLAEAPASVLMPTPAAPVRDGPLASRRDAEPFEALRDRAERGERPKIFLANLGTLADFTPRSLFTKSFFEAGGIEALGNDGFATIEAMAAACRRSGARLACLCSSDAVYARDGAEAAQALAAAGLAGLYVAGRPGADETMWRAAGIDDFVYAGCDVLAKLDSALAAAGAT